MKTSALATLALSALLASCANSYMVQGSSSVSSLDGSKLYLKDNELKDIDSCDVVHGKFQFSGPLDTVRIVNLFSDEMFVTNVVLESGVISIHVNEVLPTVKGTLLNEKFNDFREKHMQLENQLAELPHKESRMMLDGIDEAVIYAQLSQEERQIYADEDKLVTTFITDNFDNVLGPFVFRMITSGYQFPELTPQIEDIMSKATDKFKNDPYVRDYYQVAQENEARMRGVGDEPANAPAPEALPADTVASAPSALAPHLPQSQP